MKVTVHSPIQHYCTYPARGGAGIAADRIVRGLIGLGMDAKLVGLNPEAEADHITGIHYRRDPLSNFHRRHRNRQLRGLRDGYEGISPAGAVFFSDRSPNGLAMSEYFSSAKLIHFHWVCDFIDYLDTLKRIPYNIPLVWTLHDMGAFTGGCSYSLGCERFQAECGECPQLTTPRARLETQNSHKRKAEGLARVKDQLTLICPSKWLASKTRESSIFGSIRCEVIRNGFDLETFTRDKRDSGRELIGCDAHETVILFVAASVDNPLKGMRTLLDALQDLDDSSLRICYLGDKGDGQFPDYWHWLGKIHDEKKLAAVYAGSDVLVVPSEADNYPNVICEALACGVPAVASNIGGIPEQVIDGKTGFLFEKGNPQSLREQLERLTGEFPETRDRWGRSCRSFAEETFELEKVSREHVKLYKELWAAMSPA